MSAWGRGRTRPRRVSWGIATILAAGILFVGCAKKGNPAAPEEKASDARVINVAISQELTLADAYRRAARAVHDPEMHAVLRKYAAQEQEHIDGWMRELRGLGAAVDSEAEKLDYSSLKSEHDYLMFSYELTNSQLTHFLGDVTQLSTPGPQSIAAAIAASEAQHLVVLRQALGADLLEAVPDSFDTGEVPPPGVAPAGKG